MVDGEKKSAMGYNYEAIDRAMEAIAKTFSMNEEHYKEAFGYIDNRWDCQLHHPLHATIYFQNSSIYFDNKEAAGCEEVMDGLIACMERLVREVEIQDKILLELRNTKMHKVVLDHRQPLDKEK